jgi:hypothetical protein
MCGFAAHTQKTLPPYFLEGYQSIMRISRETIGKRKIPRGGDFEGKWDG